jgi:hypothetical protein
MVAKGLDIAQNGDVGSSYGTEERFAAIVFEFRELLFDSARLFWRNDGAT